MPVRIDPEQSLGFLVSDIARLLRERFNATAQRLGLTLAQARVLTRLAANEGVSQTVLATLLEVQPITLLRQIDRLEGMGLVERRAHPTDRRAQQLYLTDRAQPLLERIVEMGQQMQEGWMAGIGARDRAALFIALGRIRTNLGQPAGSVEAPAEPPVRRRAKRRI